MDFALSEEQKILRDNIVRFAREVLNDGVAERDREQTFSRELWRKCGELGIQGLPVPEQYGGSGCDPLTTAIKANVLVQLDHLRTYPAIADAESQGAIKLSGCFYRFETGEVTLFEPAAQRFVSVVQGATESTTV